MGEVYGWKTIWQKSIVKSSCQKHLFSDVFFRAVGAKVALLDGSRERFHSTALIFADMVLVAHQTQSLIEALS